MKILVTTLLLFSGAASAVSQAPYNFSNQSSSVFGVFQLGKYFYRPNSSSPLQTVGMGNPGDVPLNADYDGDGRTDFAIYRPSTREFWWVKSSTGVLQSASFGDFGDAPIVADFDGDGKTDISIYRPSTSTFWYLNSSNAALFSLQVGPIGSIPAVGDIEGDGKTNAVVFDPRTARFHWVNSQGGGQSSKQLIGVTSAAIPVVANFQSANRTNLGVFDPAPGSGRFVYLQNDLQTQIERNFGQSGDWPLVADFDGDGKTDLAVRRLQNNEYSIHYLPSSTGVTIPVNVSLGVEANFIYSQPLGLSYYQPTWSGELRDATKLLAAAPQNVHQRGVPHVSKRGEILREATAESFIPLCLFHTIVGKLPSQTDPLRDVTGLQDAIVGNFNCIHTAYGLHAASGNATALNVYHSLGNSTDLLNEIGKTSLKAVIDIAHSSAISNAELAQLGAFFDKHRTNSSVLAWKAEDEASADTSPFYEQRKTSFTSIVNRAGQSGDRRSVISIDLAKPIQGNNGHWSDWNPGTPAVPLSIWSFDNYQIHTGRENSFGVCNSGYRVAGVPDSVAVVAREDSATKPIWFTLQAHSFQSSTPEYSLVRPSPAQLRNQAYSALVHGATGLFYFAYDSYVTRQGYVVGIAPAPKSDYPGSLGRSIIGAEELEKVKKLWHAATSLNREISEHQAILLTKTSQRSYSVYASKSEAGNEPGECKFGSNNFAITPIRTVLKEANGVFTMIAVNVDNQPINVKFDFSGGDPIADLRHIDSNGANVSLAQRDYSFSETFEPWGVRIFKFKSGQTRLR